MLLVSTNNNASCYSMVSIIIISIIIIMAMEGNFLIMIMEAFVIALPFTFN